MRTRTLLCGAMIAVAAQFGITAAAAQAYPNKPVRLLVGFAPGGGTDVTSRLFATKIGEKLGQPMVVENRAGAAGSIAADLITKSDPDGYRLLMMASATFIHGVLSSKVPYNVTRDFTPITFLTMAPLVLVVSADNKARNLKELIEWARAKPDGITYASDGVGATSHLAGELFQSMTKLKLIHAPFKGNAEALPALISGQIDVGFPSMATVMPMLQAGKLRAIAVTSAQRSTLLPDVPSLDELGLRGFDISAWYGVVGPPGLPKPIVDKLNTVITEVASAPEMKEMVGKQGLEMQIRGPEQFAAYAKAQEAMYSKVGKESNIKMD